MKAVLPARISRRGFLKNSITGAAVFGVAPYLFLPKSAAGVREGSCHHPNIDGLRVVGVHDPGMTSEIVPVCPWTHQDTTSFKLAAVSPRFPSSLKCSLAWRHSLSAVSSKILAM